MWPATAAVAAFDVAPPDECNSAPPRLRSKNWLLVLTDSLFVAAELAAPVSAVLSSSSGGCRSGT
jgi:hypothetical protein